MLFRSAATGDLVIYASGDSKAIGTIKPVLAGFSRKTYDVGAFGNGSRMKFVANLLVAINNVASAEAMVLGMKAGLDMDKVVATISKGAAQSWQMENRHATMARGEFDFGFAVDWMRKDLGIAIAAAQSVGAQVPVAELVDQFYSEVQALGGQRWDTSSLIQRLRAQSAH